MVTSYSMVSVYLLSRKVCAHAGGNVVEIFHLIPLSYQARTFRKRDQTTYWIWLPADSKKAHSIKEA